METIKEKFEVTPSQLISSANLKNLKLYVKNKSLKSQTFQIGLPFGHFQMVSQRTFCVAPGITKPCIIKHLPCSICTNENPFKIKITNSQKQSLMIDAYCCAPNRDHLYLIQYPKVVDIQQIQKQKEISLPIKNMSQSMIKVRFENFETSDWKIQFNKQSAIIMVSKKIEIGLKVTIFLDAHIEKQIAIFVLQEGSNSEVKYTFKLKAQSHKCTQFVGDNNKNKLQIINKQLLNGMSSMGSFIIYNDFHKETKVQMFPHIRALVPSQLAKLWKANHILFKPQKIIIPAFSSQKIQYQIVTNLTQDDENFILKYCKLEKTDQVSSYRMRSSQYYRRNSEIDVEIFFDEKKKQNILFKCSVVNPAMRVKREKQKIKIMNDSNMKVPFLFTSDTRYKVAPSKGVALPNAEIFLSLEKKKLDINFKVSLQLPQITILLDQQNKIVKRPMSSISRRPKSSQRPASVVKSVRKPNVAKQSDFLPEIPNRNSNYNQITNEQLQHLLVNYNGKKFVLANNHPEKSMALHFQDKGFLLINSGQSVQFKQNLHPLAFKVNNQSFCLRNLEQQRINEIEQFTYEPKQLKFIFKKQQQSFQVVKSVVFTNKTDVDLAVYCITSDNLFFRSTQVSNHIVVEPYSKKQYSFSFCPQFTIPSKQINIKQKVQFEVKGQIVQVLFKGELLQLDCTYRPQVLAFKQCHYGEQETCQYLNIFNVSYKKVHFEFEKHQLLKVSPQRGYINEKSTVNIQVYFKPNRHLKNYQSKLRAYIRGSHILQIPIFINTLQPSLHIREFALDFGIGILKNQMYCSFHIENNDNSNCQVQIDLQGTPLLLKQEDLDKNRVKKIVTMQPYSVQEIGVTCFALKQGRNILKLEKQIAKLVDYGPIPSPRNVMYTGKQTLISISPSENFYNITLTQKYESFKFTIKNLIEKPLKLKTILKQHQEKSKSLLISCQPSQGFLAVQQPVEVSLNCMIVDLELIKQKPKDYSLIILVNGQHYTQIKFKFHMPIPFIQLQPTDLILPTVGLNEWSHKSVKIINRGYKQIYIKIIKPANINFQIDYKLPFTKLTRLKNEVEVPVLFRSKKKISFNVILLVNDNFGNSYPLKLSGTATDSPLFISVSGQITPRSNKSLNSCSQLSSMVNINQQDTQDFQFLQKWLSVYLPNMRTQSKTFPIFLKDYNNLLLMLSQFGLNFPSKLQLNSLQKIMEQMKKLGYQINSINITQLQLGDKNSWVQFIWHFLSQRLIHQDCLKWISKTCSLDYITYDTIYSNFKKLILDIFNRVFQTVLLFRIKQWSKLCQKVSPYLHIFNEVINKKHMIVELNVLHHKLANISKETIRTTSLNYNIVIENLQQTKRNICYWVLHSKDCSIQNDIFKFHLGSEESKQIKLSLKNNSEVIIFNDSLFQPLHIYEIQITQTEPIVHKVTIQAQDKCTQQWNLDFVSPLQSIYFIEFNGSSQFKCKAPSSVTLKQQQVFPIKILYSPNNLKQHHGTLSISNKYFKELYQINGKPLCSQIIEYQQRIFIKQGVVYQQTVILPWQFNPEQLSHRLKDPKFQPLYKVIEYNGHFQQLKRVDIDSSKINRKQIKIEFQFLFDKIYKNLELLYQVVSQDHNTKIIKFYVTVIPKPVEIDGQIICQIGKTLREKIPIKNISQNKENVRIDVLKQSQNKEFRLSRSGLVKLQPGQVQYISLIYKPESFHSKKFNFKLSYEQSNKVFIFNWIGTPQFPVRYQDPIQLQCQVQQQLKHKLKIENLLAEKIKYDVETNVPQIAGKDNISINAKQQGIYQFTILPLHPGQINGQLIFIHEKLKIVYKINVKVSNKNHHKKLLLISQIRKSSTVTIQLQNKSNKDIKYDVICNSQYLQTNKTLQISSYSQKVLQLSYLPYFEGTKYSQLKLYHPTQSEIVYQIQMRSQPHQQSLAEIQCEMEETNFQKICIKNTTQKNCQLNWTNLPEQISIKEIKPLPLNQKGAATLNIQYKPIKLVLEYRFNLRITSQIGSFNYKLQYVTKRQKKMNPIEIFYEKKQLRAEGALIFKNKYQSEMNLNVTSNISSIQFDKKFIQVKPYSSTCIKFSILKVDFNEDNFIYLKNKQPKVSWIYPILAYQLEQRQQNIDIRGTAQVLAKGFIKNCQFDACDKILVSGISQDAFNFSPNAESDKFLYVMINKTCSYKGFVIFFTGKRAFKYPLSIQLNAPKIEKIILQANVGERSTMKLTLKNGQGDFQVEIQNNKLKQFSVQPLQGKFDQRGEASVTVNYQSKNYSGVKRAKVSILSQTNCSVFQLHGKFPKIK